MSNYTIPKSKRGRPKLYTDDEAKARMKIQQQQAYQRRKNIKALYDEHISPTQRKLSRLLTEVLFNDDEGKQAVESTYKSLRKIAKNNYSFHDDYYSDTD